ncbi:roadblock/LC7 domain-containing protein [Acinetobacter sp. NS-4]|uniref:roadblock/LC7 domain-containing protein n=1 Tax=Acinetobacter sp. NS-4 TaxID=3127956 RepID=UPI00307F6AD0
MQIHELLNNVSGLDFVMLCSSDGFQLALASKKKLENTGKIAAVSSSILAMVSAFISEINLIGCKMLSLDAENGHVVLTGVEHAHYPMLIVAVGSSDVLMGQMRYEVKKTSEFLAKINA